MLTAGPDETPPRRASRRLLHVDDCESLGVWRSLLVGAAAPQVAGATDQAVDRAIAFSTDDRPAAAHPQVRVELTEPLGVLVDRIDHVHFPLASHPDAPLPMDRETIALEAMADRSLVIVVEIVDYY